MTKQELTPRQKEIRRWLLENPRKTENDVVKAMNEKGQCSRMTTLHEIKELKGRQILEDIRAKPNNFSCLVVRDENEYTRIYQAIAKIKSVIDVMDGPTEKCFSQSVEWSTHSDTQEATSGVNFLWQLQTQIWSKYREGYSLILQLLWDRTNSIIQSEKDKQTLHTMIVNLMMKMNSQRWYPRELKQIFEIYAYDTRISNWTLSKKMGITKELIEKLNSTQKDIVERFLD